MESMTSAYNDMYDDYKKSNHLFWSMVDSHEDLTKADKVKILFHMEFHVRHNKITEVDEEWTEYVGEKINKIKQGIYDF